LSVTLPTLASPLQAYLRHLGVERRLSPRTLAIYTDALGRLQASAGDEGVELKEALPHHLRSWAARLRGRGLAPRSIALVLSAWRGLYRYWGRLGLVAHNPVEGLRAPKSSKPLPKALSVEQAVQLADHAAARIGEQDRAAAAVLARRDHAIVELLYGGGLRVAEILGLDLEASTAASTQGRGWVDRADGTAHVFGKGSKRRSVPVGRTALAALDEWTAVRHELARGDESALFVSRLGTRLSPGQLRLRLKAQSQASGLATPVHPHMLRHSFASHLLQSSGDLRAVQELLGHASIGTTQVYTKLDHQHLAKVYDAAHPRARRASGKPPGKPPGALPGDSPAKPPAKSPTK
jgi:integrase/recombinase XerC